MATYHSNYNSGDDTTGDGSTGTPYKTLHKACQQLSSPGDKVKFCNDGGGSDNSNNTVGTLTCVAGVAGLTGTAANPYEIIGTNASWVEDGTQGTLDSSSRQLGFHLNTSSYVTIRNITAVGTSQFDCFTINGAPGTFNTIENCVASSSARYGISILTGTDNLIKDTVSHTNTNYGFSIINARNALINCKAYGCTNGFNHTGVDHMIIGCTSYSNSLNGFNITSFGRTTDSYAYSNTQSGFVFDRLMNVSNNVAALNGQRGFYSTGSIAYQMLEHCTAYLNTGNNFEFSSASAYVLFRYDRSHESGAYGLTIAAGAKVFGNNNTFYDNSSGAVSGSFFLDIEGAETTGFSTDLADATNADYSSVSVATLTQVVVPIGYEDSTTSTYKDAGTTPEASGGGGGRRPRAKYNIG